MFNLEELGNISNPSKSCLGSDGNKLWQIVIAKANTVEQLKRLKTEKSTSVGELHPYNFYTCGKEIDETIAQIVSAAMQTRDV